MREVRIVCSCLMAVGGCSVFNSVDQYHNRPEEHGKAGVYLQTGFEENRWYEKWGQDHAPDNTAVVEKDPEFGFAPWHGKALRMTIRKGQHLGVDLSYHFAKDRKDQPEEMYLRYYLRLSHDF